MNQYYVHLKNGWAGALGNLIKIVSANSMDEAVEKVLSENVKPEERERWKEHCVYLTLKQDMKYEPL